MNEIQKHTTPEKLEKYSFYWSEARLILAAIALLLGGIPVVMKLGFYSFGNLLGICQIISGLAAAYLLYRWIQNDKKLFGKTDKVDLAAFAVMIISGLHLGIAGLLGINIGMQVTSSYTVFVIAAVAYIWAGWHLCKMRKANGNRIF